MRVDIDDKDAEVLGNLLPLLVKGSNVKTANNVVRDALNADPEIFVRVAGIINTNLVKRKDRVKTDEN